MQTPLPEDKLNEVKAELFKGQKITAIKVYREATGAGLAEAKSAVETLEADLRASTPDSFTTPPGGGGCFGIVVLCVLLGTAAWKCAIS